MKKTMQEKIAEYLISLGYIENRDHSTKYRVFDGNGKRYYLGKNGAVRKGKNIVESILVTDIFQTVINEKKYNKSTK